MGECVSVFFFFVFCVSFVEHLARATRLTNKKASVLTGRKPDEKRVCVSCVYD